MVQKLHAPSKAETHVGTGKGRLLYCIDEKGVDDEASLAHGAVSRGAFWHKMI